MIRRWIAFPILAIAAPSSASALTLDERLQQPTVTGSRAGGRDISIYYRADGTLATPLPDHPTEKDRFRVGIEVAAGVAASSRIEVTACDEPRRVRVLGSHVSLMKPEAAAAHLRPAEATTLIESPWFQCANAFGYHVTVDATKLDITASIPIEPVYLLAWGAALAFDFGAPHRLSLKDRPTAAGSTEKFVSESDDLSGVRPIVFIALHPCRANPKDWTACDWVSPIVGLDPGAAGDGFVFGLELAPFPGVGMIGGVSVFKSDAIDPRAGVTAGDPFATPGDLPKSQAFRRDGIGGFIGVSVSSEVFGELFP